MIIFFSGDPNIHIFVVACHGVMRYNDVMATAAKIRAVEKYNAKSYERLTVRIRKEDADEIRAAIGDRSINGFVNDAIREKIEREKKK